MKKKMTKFISLTAAALLAAGALAGCSNDTAETDNTAAPASNSSDELVMGTNAAFPPFEFVTSEGIVGEFDGIDVAIADRIAKSMDKTLRIEDMEFDSLITALSTGKIDVILAGMTATDERRQSVDFSDPYFVAEQVILTASDSTIASAEDLKAEGVRIGVVQGYTGDTIVSETMGLEPAVRTSRGVDAVQDLKNGKLDAVVIDSATGEKLAAQDGLKVVRDPEVFETEQYAIAVQKGNTELLDQINKVLDEMQANGEIDALNDKYNG